MVALAIVVVLLGGVVVDGAITVGRLSPVLGGAVVLILAALVATLCG